MPHELVKTEPGTLLENKNGEQKRERKRRGAEGPARGARGARVDEGAAGPGELGCTPYITFAYTDSAGGV